MIIVRHIFTKILAFLFFSVLFSGPVLAEKINLDGRYFWTKIMPNCLMIYSKKDRMFWKVQLTSPVKWTAKITTEAWDVFEAKVSFPDGHFRMEHQYGSSIMVFTRENGKSYFRNVDQSESEKQLIRVGRCKTKYSNISSLKFLPPSEGSASTAAVNPSTVKVEKGEIAALEKKLAALKQKAARKEEYQKMRALLDQKLKEVQGQIQMLEQEYKDVLN